MAYLSDNWVDDLARSYPNFDPKRGKFCPCNDCARLKKAAAQIDDITWWTGDEAARAVVKAQKAIWEARKTLDRLHRSGRLHVNEPVSI